MNFSGIGDLAQNLMLRRQGAGLKSQMTRLTQELTTGQSSNVSSRVRGDFGALAGIETHLSKLDAFQRVRDDLTLKSGAMQSVLGAIQASVDGFGAELVSSATLEQNEIIEAKSANALGLFDQVIALLNTQSSDRSLFSGTATEQISLASSDDMMGEIRAIAVSATDGADLVARLDSWFFDSGGGFELSGYLGGLETTSDLSISNTAKVDLTVKADNAGFRHLLRGLALTALVSEGAVPTNTSDVSELFVSAGQSILDGQYALTSLQRQTGDVQAKLEREDLAAQSERVAVEQARAKIASVDPFEAAAELEAVQFQIETLYVLTARMSQLRLSDYLR